MFKEELARQEKSGHTIRAYAKDVQEFRSYAYNIRHNKPATVNRKLVVIEKYFNILKGRVIVRGNPATDVKHVKYQKQSGVEALESKDLYRLKRKLYMSGNKRDIAVFELMVYTGLREADVCILKLDDISISERKGSVTVRSCKCGNTEVPLNAETRSAIVSYIEVRPR